jgi:hypothetical protein
MTVRKLPQNIKLAFFVAGTGIGTFVLFIVLGGLLVTNSSSQFIAAISNTVVGFALIISIGSMIYLTIDAKQKFNSGNNDTGIAALVLVGCLLAVYVIAWDFLANAVQEKLNAGLPVLISLNNMPIVIFVSALIAIIAGQQQYIRLSRPKSQQTTE